MRGRVYLTPRVETALRYALNRASRGLILDVLVMPGAEILPDEDCVGEAMQYATTGGGERYVCGWNVGAVWDDEDLMRELNAAFDSLPRHVKRRWVRVMEPDVRDLAVAGKRVLRRRLISPQATLRLVRYGANVSVRGPMLVCGAWVVERTADGHYPMVRMEEKAGGLTSVRDWIKSDLDKLPYVTNGWPGLRVCEPDRPLGLEAA